MDASRYGYGGLAGAEGFEFEDEADAWGLGEADAFHPALLGPATSFARAPALPRPVPAAGGWTRCFSEADIAKVAKAYQENAAFAGLNPVDRCSCIVMLNVALGQLLALPLKRNRARGKSARIVRMGNLTTHTIEAAMAQLGKRGYAGAPTIIDFFDARLRTAGTLAPQKLKASVQAKLLDLTNSGACWFAFGLSILDGYHSVLLLVDRRAALPKIYWLDQFSAGITDNVTTSLDQRLTKATQSWWQKVKAAKGKGYRTMIRLWPLRKRVKP